MTTPPDRVGWMVSEILRRHLDPKGYVINECKPTGINPITCQPTYLHTSFTTTMDHRLLCGWNGPIGSCGMIWERFRIDVNLLESSPAVSVPQFKQMMVKGTFGKHQLITNFPYMLCYKTIHLKIQPANIDLRMHTGDDKNLHQLIELVAYPTCWRGL